MNFSSSVLSLSSKIPSRTRLKFSIFHQGERGFFWFRVEWLDFFHGEVLVRGVVEFDLLLIIALFFNMSDDGRSLLFRTQCSYFLLFVKWMMFQYSTVEEAIVARGRLHNVVWPPHSPKTLKVDYSDDDGVSVCGVWRVFRFEDSPLHKGFTFQHLLHPLRTLIVHMMQSKGSNCHILIKQESIRWEKMSCKKWRN